jgi:Uncharacterized conserved protein
MSKARSSLMDSLRHTSTRRECSIFIVSRTDGAVLLLTDHPRSLPIGALTYSPTGIFQLSAQSEEEGILAPARAEAVGALGPVFTYSAMLAKKYEFAQIIEIKVDWRFPYLGSFGANRYWVQGVSFDKFSFKFALTDLRGFLANIVGRTYTTDCDHVHYGDRCAVKELTTMTADWELQSAAVIGDTELVIDSGSTNPVVGDSFSFANTSDPTIYTIDAVTGAGTLTLEIDPPLQADHSVDDELIPSKFAHSGTVQTVATRRNFLTENVTAGLGANYFRRGKIRWITGANANIETDVKEHAVDAVPGEYSIVLLEPTPFNIQVGDTFTAIAGCDHTHLGLHGCLKKFGNTRNVGAFKDIPGADKLLDVL